VGAVNADFDFEVYAPSAAGGKKHVRHDPHPEEAHALTLAARACARHTGTGTGLPRGVAG